MNSYFLNAEAVFVTIDGKNFSVTSGHPAYNQVISAVANEDWDIIPGLINPIGVIESDIAERSQGSLAFDGSNVLYNGEPLFGAAVDHISMLYRNGLPFDRYLKFLAKLQQNPSFRSREQAFRFIETNRITLDDDGDLIMYKWIRDDYLDCHSGTFYNGIGAEITMDRAKVDDDPQRTCSAGLHVCTEGYTAFGSRLMLAKVDPADIVSVPIDYRNSKLRVCRYVIVAEVEREAYGHIEDDGLYYGEDGDQYDESDVEGVVRIEVDGEPAFAFRDSENDWQIFGLYGYSIGVPYDTCCVDLDKAIYTFESDSH